MEFKLTKQSETFSFRFAWELEVNEWMLGKISLEVQNPVIIFYRENKDQKLLFDKNKEGKTEWIDAILFEDETDENSDFN